MAIDTDERGIRHNTPQTFENNRVQEYLTDLIESQLGSMGPILLKKYFPDGHKTKREHAYQKLTILECSLEPFLGESTAKKHIKILKKKLENYDLYHSREPISTDLDNSKIHSSLGTIIKEQMGDLGSHLLKEYFPEERTTHKKEACKKLAHMECILGPFFGESRTRKYVGDLRTKLLANGVDID